MALSISGDSIRPLGIQIASADNHDHAADQSNSEAPPRSSLAPNADGSNPGHEIREMTPRPQIVQEDLEAAQPRSRLRIIRCNDSACCYSLYHSPESNNRSNGNSYNIIPITIFSRICMDRRGISSRKWSSLASMGKAIRHMGPEGNSALCSWHLFHHVNHLCHLHQHENAHYWPSMPRHCRRRPVPTRKYNYR